MVLKFMCWPRWMTKKIIDKCILRVKRVGLPCTTFCWVFIFLWSFAASTKSNSFRIQYEFITSFTNSEFVSEFCETSWVNGRMYCYLLRKLQPQKTHLTQRTNEFWKNCCFPIEWSDFQHEHYLDIILSQPKYFPVPKNVFFFLSLDSLNQIKFWMDCSENVWTRTDRIKCIKCCRVERYTHIGEPPH